MTSKKQVTPELSTNTGSPQVGGPVYLAIGKLQRTHGVKGELVLDVLTDFPQRIKVGRQVFIGNQHKEYVIASVRPNGNTLLVGFEGLIDCDQASIVRNQLVYIRTEDAQVLPEGEFYHHEIEGMSVFDETGKLIGLISEVLITGANDVYVVASDSGDEILIPAIKSVVISIDRKERKMVVRLPEWE